MDELVKKEGVLSYRDMAAMLTTNQSVVSRTVSLLEEGLDVPLAKRTEKSRFTGWTDDGKRVLRIARPVVSLYEIGRPDGLLDPPEPRNHRIT
jgi:DNA-binding transcriptional LysR family regulator